MSVARGPRTIFARQRGIREEQPARPARARSAISNRLGNGYGPSRTRRILSATPHAADRLRDVVRTLASDGALAGYRRLGDKKDCNVKHLGVAFGTKFLYFCQPGDQPRRALIHDKHVSEWLLEYSSQDLSCGDWSEPRYSDYLNLMHGWSAELGCAPDQVELCIFRAAAEERGSQWGSGS